MKATSHWALGRDTTSLLRQIFDTIVTDHSRIDPEIALRIAIKATNNTMEPKGVGLLLLVYGSIPPFHAVNMPAPQQKERMRALQTAGSEISSITARLRSEEALRSRLSAAAKYDPKPGNAVRVY